MAITVSTVSIYFTTDDKQVAQYPLTGQGGGTVSFDGSTLAAGTYKYYLVIDGKVIDTKTMVITSK